MASQRVGTAPVIVTHSALMSSRSPSGSSCGPANTNFAPTSAAGERETPTIHVEHRGDGEDRVPLRDAEAVGHGAEEGVEDERAVRVGDPLEAPVVPDV